MPDTYDPTPPPIGTNPYVPIDKFVQIFDTNEITAISYKEFTSAPFDELCPSGNCLEDCLKLERVFQSIPDGVDAVTSTYGRPDSDQRATLFEICSNMYHALATIPQDFTLLEDIRSYFPVTDTAVNDVATITSGIASCFASTCDMTREPEKCKDACSFDNFLATPEQLNYNFESNNTGALVCISRLCDNTCGLPYADQDVLGIGVLTSYYIQAVLLVVMAFLFMASLIWQLWRWPGQKPKVHEKLKRPLETLLTVQTYFGFSAAVATFVMKPAAVDTLNGYALIAVTIMGFLPPVFTMMLYHSHDLKSWFSTGLVLASYMINTVAFFVLHKNLSTTDDDAEVLATGLENLFSSTSCAGSSAMALCHQLTGSQPLGYLDLFLNHGPIPNIKTFPILWGWTTLVLLVLIGYQSFISHKSKAAKEADEKPFDIRQPRIGTSAIILRLFRLPATRVILLSITSTLFGLCLVYEYFVVREYQRMDVIDKTGWSFGQVVAVLFWIPPVLDTIHSVLARRCQRNLRSEDSGAPYLSQAPTRHSLLPPWRSIQSMAYFPTPRPNMHDDGIPQGTDGSYDNVGQVKDRRSMFQHRWIDIRQSRGKSSSDQEA